MKRVVFLLILLFTISGCGSNALEPIYDKMQIGEKGINGYELYLSIYGVRNGINIDDNMKIVNYNDKEYKITLISERNKDEERLENEIIYVLNNKTYIQDKKGKYTLFNIDIKYNNPSIYLNGLKSASKISEPKKEKIGTLEYDVYDVTYSKDILNDFINDTNIGNITPTKDITGKVYIDSEGYPYRIIYIIDDVTITANYYSINEIESLNLPNEIISER